VEVLSSIIIMMSNYFGRKKMKSADIVRRFIDLYARDSNWHNIDKATGNLGYGWIHYGLIRNLRPKRILVIGSQYGFIPAICALACRDEGLGVVDFVDAGYDYTDERQKNQWGGVGFWKKVDIEKHFGAFNLNKHIRTHVMTSKKFFSRYPRRRWDYINIDGDHSYKGVKYDFENCWPRLKDKGYISLHDIYPKKLDHLIYGVHRYWKEIKRKYPNTLEFAGECGLGLLPKL
jgi:hypothetical protein